MTLSLKKFLADCFKTLADGPKTGLLAARAISSADICPREITIQSVPQYAGKMSVWSTCA